MADQAAREFVPAPEMLKLGPDDPFMERAQEISGLIARHAYELFESRGFEHGQDREDWLRAESEILLIVPADITETESEFTIRAEVPGFSERDLEVRVAARALCITGKRHEDSDQKEEKTVYSGRRANQIFRVLDLPSQIDPDSVNATLNDSILEIKVSKLGMGKKIPVLATAAAA